MFMCIRSTMDIILSLSVGSIIEWILKRFVCAFAAFRGSLLTAVWLLLVWQIVLLLYQSSLPSQDSCADLLRGWWGTGGDMIYVAVVARCAMFFVSRGI
jgi:hypothetical protein